MSHTWLFSRYYFVAILKIRQRDPLPVRLCYSKEAACKELHNNLQAELIQWKEEFAANIDHENLTHQIL